jgi:hypothetical protein
MGRATGWLAAQRPAMIKILAEIELKSSYTRGSAGNGDIGLLLACMSHVAAGPGIPPRSVPAMRQAWWRWTTDSPQAATPPVQELALIVRHAKNHGWLRELEHPDCLSLVNKLLDELEKKFTSDQKILEKEWEPTVLMGIEGFFDFLEAQIFKHARGELYLHYMPDAKDVQLEVRAMVIEMITRTKKMLMGPRDLFEDQHESDAYIQPFEGWPDVLRALASEASKILNEAAEDCEAIEASHMPMSPDSTTVAKRKRIFPMPAQEPEEE